MIGMPVRELPENKDTRPYAGFWNDVAKLCKENKGQWIPVDPPGKITAARAAYGIRNGNYRVLQGFEARSRNKQLFVRFV